MAFIKKWSLRLLLLVVFVVVLLLATDNSQVVALSFLSYQTVESPLSWWVIGAFLFGMVFSMSLNVMTTTRLRLALRRARQSAEQSLVALDKVNAGTKNLATTKPVTTMPVDAKPASDVSSRAPLSTNIAKTT
jgi:uncharacterized integral membrane protein